MSEPTIRPDDVRPDGPTNRRPTRSHRPLRRTGDPPYPHPRPPTRQGPGPEVGHAHELRPVHGGHLRRGRDPGPVGRRLRGEQRLRLRDNGSHHRRRTPPARPRRRTRDDSQSRHRGPAVRFVRGGAEAGAAHRRTVHEGRRLPRGQARGRSTVRQADRGDHQGRHPGHGPHRIHAAERARASADTASRDVAMPPRTYTPTLTRSPRPERLRSCSKWSRAASRNGSPTT